MKEPGAISPDIPVITMSAELALGFADLLQEFADTLREQVKVECPDYKPEAFSIRKFDLSGIGSEVQPVNLRGKPWPRIARLTDEQLDDAAPITDAMERYVDGELEKRMGGE